MFTPLGWVPGLTLLFLVWLSGCTAETHPRSNERLNGADNLYIHKSASLSPYLEDYEDHGRLSPSTLDAQLSEPWSFSFDVSSAEAVSTISVSSCEDYFRASGAEPVQPFEYPVYNSLGKRCLAAKWIANMTSAEESYIGEITVDEGLVASLPKEFSFIVSTSEWQRIMEDREIKTWSDVYEIKHIETTSPYELTVDLAAARQELVLLARGDMNDDGIEDVLFKVLSYSLEGTYSAMHLFVVTRRSSDSSFELARHTKADS